MKKLFVFVPAIIVALFLLNSFVLKEKEPVIKTTKATRSKLLNIVYRSADGGKTWQNISVGLPENLQRGGLWVNGVFANDRGLYLRVGNGVYHTEPHAANLFWTKDVTPGTQNYLAPGNNGILVYNFRGQIFKKANGTGNWSPMYTHFQEQAVRLNTTVDWMYKNYKEKQVSNVFETTGGTVFIGSNNAIYRSTNSGKTWKYMPVTGWVTKMVELNGVLLANSSRGVFKSTDNGENWERVINEEGAGIAVEIIDGGFAAIVNNPVTQTNTMHISLDGGKTWNNIDEKLQPSWSNSLMKKTGLVKSSPAIMSIKQMGKYLICGRSDGAFRSADMGKTWEKISLPAVENKGFSLSVSGNVMYAMPNKGC